MSGAGAARTGRLSHGLRAALAARMCRHVGDEALTAHYETYLAHSSDLDMAAARPARRRMW